MRKKSKRLVYIGIYNIKDLKMILGYIINSEKSVLLDSIFNNPSIDYLDGIDKVLEAIDDPNSIFYYDIDSQIIHVKNKNTNRDKITMKVEYYNDLKEFGLAIHVYGRKQSIIHIIPSFNILNIIKVQHTSYLPNSYKFEVSAFDEYGLKNNCAIIDEDSMLVINRNKDGYTAHGEFADLSNHTAYTGVFNVDTNSPLVEFSGGRLVDKKTLLAGSSTTFEVGAATEEYIRNFLSDNSAYLPLAAKERLLELMLGEKRRDIQK